MPVQINMTIARHNAEELPAVLELVRGLGAEPCILSCWFPSAAVSKSPRRR